MIIVYIPCKDKDQAKNISKELVKKKEAEIFFRLGCVRDNLATQHRDDPVQLAKSLEQTLCDLIEQTFKPAKVPITKREFKRLAQYLGLMIGYLLYYQLLPIRYYPKEQLLHQ